MNMKCSTVWSILVKFNALFFCNVYKDSINEMHYFGVNWHEKYKKEHAIHTS